MLEFSDADTDTDSEFEMEAKQDTVTVKDMYDLANSVKSVFIHWPGPIQIVCNHCMKHVFQEFFFDDQDIESEVSEEGEWIVENTAYSTIYERVWDWKRRGTREAAMREPHFKGTTIHNVYDFLLKFKEIEMKTDNDISTCCHYLLRNN